MNIFQMKTKPHGNERFQQFINENFVCIGWPSIGDLSNVSKDDLRDRIAKSYKWSGHQLGNALGQVNTFTNTMKTGDYVIITEKNRAYIGIVSDYFYEATYDNDQDGMCHRRSVQWIGNPQVNELNLKLQKLIANRNTICEFPDTYEESGIEKILSTAPVTNKQTNSRLDDLFNAALAILEAELKSDDSDRRLKAATELIRLKRGANY